jgi:hypothetical protein
MSEQSLENQVIERAQADAAFRTELLTDPRAAIESAFGVTPLIDVRVIEERPNEVVLVLPSAGLSGEVADDELAQVAGGVYSSATWWRVC